MIIEGGVKNLAVVGKNGMFILVQFADLVLCLPM